MKPSESMVANVPQAHGPAPYRTRAAATAKRVYVGGDFVEVVLIMDHGFRVYSEQHIRLNGVVPVEHRLCESFISNWLAHTCKPSTLWVVTFGESSGARWLAAIERDGLTEFGKLSGELHSLAEDLIEQGLAKTSEPDA